MRRTAALMAALFSLCPGIALAAAPAKTPTAGRTESARSCTIGSFRGVLLPGSSVCVRVSGFVRYDWNSGAADPTRPGRSHN